MVPLDSHLACRLCIINFSAACSEQLNGVYLTLRSIVSAQQSVTLLFATKSVNYYKFNTYGGGLCMHIFKNVRNFLRMWFAPKVLY